MQLGSPANAKQQSLGDSHANWHRPGGICGVSVVTAVVGSGVVGSGAVGSGSVGLAVVDGEVAVVGSAVDVLDSVVSSSTIGPQPNNPSVMTTTAQRRMSTR